MKIKYREEVDGLRAIAVISVIFFHADFKIFFNGGYVGVDIFFVISGYLITTIILKDLSNNTFSFKYFYERRIRRIFPALFFLIFLTSILSFIILSRSELSSFFSSAIATLFFYSNFHFYKNIPYFASEAELLPLLHTWSLSIEEQFYLVFPTFIFLIHKYFKKYVLIFLIVVLFLSLLFCILAALYTSGVLNFYFTITRLWELILGSVSAYFLFTYKSFNLSKILKQFLSLFGVILILFSIFFFDKNMRYPSIYTLFPTVGTVLIILFANKKTYVNKVLSFKFLVNLGLISYSLYLIHWPLFAFGKLYFEVYTIKLKIFLIFVSLTLSFISWKFIEQPFRKKAIISFKTLLISLIVFLIIFIFISKFIINHFKSDSINGFESKSAQLLMNYNSIYLSKMDERLFTKFRIIYEDLNPKTLIIGSSRTKLISNHLLKRNSINLSVDSATLEDQITITSIAIEKFDIDTVIISADPWLFNNYITKPAGERWLSLEKEYKRAILDIQNKRKLNIIDKNFSKNVNYNHNAIDVIYDKINLQKSQIASAESKFNYKSLIFRDGSMVYSRQMLNNLQTKGLPIKHFIEPFQFSQARLELYEDFIKYLIESKKNVIFILVPFYEQSYKSTLKENLTLISMENKFIDIAKKYNLKIVGSYNPEAMGCNKDEFYDDMHPLLGCIEKIIKEVN